MSTPTTHLLIQLGLLLGYLGAVSVGGYSLGKASDILLGRLQARIIGGVLLGFAATLPEYLFALISTFEHRNDVALGSAFGGNIFLFTLLFGLLFLDRRSSHTSYKGLKFDFGVLGLSTLIILFGFSQNTLSVYLGLILVLIYALFIGYTAKAKNSLEHAEGIPLSVGSKLKALVYFGVGLALTAAFVHPLVDQVVVFSHAVGVPPVITSFTLVPAGDELPELVAMFTLLRSNHSSNTDEHGFQTAYASLVGSKVQSNTLLIGTIVMVASMLGTPIAADRYSLFTLYAMVATTFMGMAAAPLRTRRSVGLLLIASYFIIVGVAVGVEI
ncbi:MAG: hypothetical protein QW688_06595 [Thermoprotei archaeon]